MLHIFISGYVQGVGFRQYVRYKAKKLNVTGWIRNLSDGRVETGLFGSEENLQKMVMFCRRGPFLARVQNVEIKREEDLKMPQNFEILK